VRQRRQELVLAPVRLPQRVFRRARLPGVAADARRGPPHQADEQQHLHQRPAGGAERPVVEAGALARQPQRPQRQRHHDDRRQQPAKHEPARILAPQRRRQTVLGQRRHEGDAERGEHRRRLQGDAGEARDREQLARPVRVADEREAGERDRNQRQRARDPAGPLAPGRERDPAAEQQERRRRGRPHPARRGRGGRAGRLVEDQRVDPEVGARQVLEQREPPDRRHERPERARHARPPARRQQQERRPRDRGADGRVELHPDGGAVPGGQLGHAQRPAEHAQHAPDERVEGDREAESAYPGVRSGGSDGSHRQRQLGQLRAPNRRVSLPARRAGAFEKSRTSSC
jgi:hypothetical protein